MMFNQTPNACFWLNKSPACINMKSILYQKLCQIWCTVYNTDLLKMINEALHWFSIKTIFIQWCNLILMISFWRLTRTTNDNLIHLLFFSKAVRCDKTNDTIFWKPEFFWGKRNIKHKTIDKEIAQQNTKQLRYV